MPFGDATFEGSPTGKYLSSLVSSMAATPDGKGYWLVAADGGVFAYGDAKYWGSTGNIRLYAPDRRNRSDTGRKGLLARCRRRRDICFRGRQIPRIHGR